MRRYRYSRSQTQVRVQKAKSIFIKENRYLLRHDLNERTISHKFAEALQDQFPGWHVDCEYNRRGEKAKRQGGQLVRPDIIIHHRGVPENLLCIEAKKEGESLDDDKIKLKNFTEPLGDDRYQFGLLLVLSLKAPYKITCEWFLDGNAI